jgi:hypothetical protein
MNWDQKQLVIRIASNFDSYCKIVYVESNYPSGWLKNQILFGQLSLT